MKLIESKFAYLIQETYNSKFGTIHFIDNIVISEVNEGIIFNTECSQELAKLITNYYGKAESVHIVSNRVHNYSVVPTYWIDFNKSKYAKCLESISFITYNKLAFANAKLEQDFINTRSECFKNFEDAMNWLNTLNKKMIA